MAQFGKYNGFTYTTYQSEKTGVWFAEAFDEVGAALQEYSEDEDSVVYLIKDRIDEYIELMG